MNNYEDFLTAIKNAKRVYIAGNGGSAANALHIANDLISCNIKAQALSGDVATITAIANDFGYEHIFSRQIELLCEPADLLIALSGSGNSVNILKAIISANRRGMKTFAIVGAFENGAAQTFSNQFIEHGSNMQEAEDYQITLIHRVYRELKGLK